MSEETTLDTIREHWVQSAQTHKGSHRASWTDRQVMELEIKNVLEYVENGDTVLDVGCANGWSTIHWAVRRDTRVRGVDYVPEMVEAARERLATYTGPLRGSLEFARADLVELDEPDATYDKVVSIRTIINLGAWENQLRGLEHCARVLKPGGLLLLSEATVQGWTRLNELRAEWGLGPIGMPSFNNYLDVDRVVEALAPRAELVRLVEFAGTYFVGTRLLKPLLAKIAGNESIVADPESHWNRWCAQLPQAGDYGTQKLFVFRKR